ncbi:multidrug ABC transporter permease [Catellatospora sp. TT07R-123]|nr:multidrug ABC transporter permease [Catellatospora sp. TT07R-123]
MQTVRVEDGARSGAPARAMARRLGQAARQCWRAAPRLLLTALALNLVGGLLPVAVAFYTKQLLDGLAWPSRAIWPPLAAVVVGGAAMVLVQQLSGFVDHELRRRIATDVQRRLFAKVNTFIGLGRFEDPRLHDQLRMAQQSGGFAPQQIAGAGPRLARAAVQSIGFAVAVWALWPPILALVVVAALPAIVAEVRLARANAQLESTISHTLRRRHFYETLLTEPDAAKEVRLFGIGGFLYDKLVATLTATDRAEAALDRRLTTARTLLGLLGQLVTAAGLILAVSRAAAGDLSVGDVVLLLAALAGVQACLLSMVGDLGMSYGALLTYGAYQDLLSMAGDLPAGELPAPPLRQGVEFRDVWFRYDEDGPWVLRGVSLTLRHGESVGLVGENGAGKSTLVKLLCRFYDPQRGQILWDGVDVRTLRTDELRARVAAVFQDFVRYDLTVRENIGLGDLPALDSADRVRRAADLAEADGFLAGLPQGYDTLLSRIFYADEQDRSGVGSTLSGGQWQRVALARSLMRGDADLLIMDEPSSGLDANAEFRVHETLRTHRLGRTSLLISHRLSAIRAADHVVVLDGGQVVESGSHDELVAARGHYAQMYQRQAEGYQELVS